MTMTTSSPVRYEREVPQVLGLLEKVEAELSASTLAPGLRHLVKLRVSQINQCAYCVKLHTREARRDGETDDRLDRLVVWRHVADFTPAEKAALSWAEALTHLDPAADYAPLRATLREHFDDTAIGALTSAVAMINLWNRFQISGH
ncbi:MAG TPA: carboxymuconolactone decarboxylase family protein [Acidimicrobiales bacterium]|nr:carboxymuconolactone decarboxylase family protein [Acidimicrobiales bacterium]